MRRQNGKIIPVRDIKRGKERLRLSEEKRAQVMGESGTQAENEG